MKQRLIAAIVLACLALTLLLLRYLPQRAELRELGDPADPFVAAGFGQAEVRSGAVVLPVAGVASLRVPLADGRGALTAVLRMRAEAAAPVLVLQSQPLPVPAAATFRTVHLLVPPSASRAVHLAIAEGGGGVEVDQLLTVGRGGWPPLADLLALLCVATIPAVISLLALRLPFDWALLAGSVPLLYVALFPAADRPVLLLFGPLAAAALAGLACLPSIRRLPGLALVLVAGAALRCYGLGWGSGYAFHADERALVHLLERAELLVLLGLRLPGTLPGPANAIWSAVLLLRALSALAGTAVIAAVYLLGLRLLRPRWALLAAAFAAGAPLLVQQGHVAALATCTTLLVALVLLASTLALGDARRWPLMWAALLAVVLVTVSPAAVGWLAAPLVAGFAHRREQRWPVLAQAALLLLCGSLWWFGDVLAGAAEPSRPDAIARVSVPYLYPLFNMLLWGMGPLLMQLGVVGSVVALIVCCFPQRMRGVAGRRMLPLLSGMVVAFAIVGRGPHYELATLSPFVPPLCLAAAFLLQSFCQRLYPGFGQRTVRLLGGTALALAMATSIGLLNVYRVPDVRIAASRWLLAHAAAQSVLLDVSLPVSSLQQVRPGGTAPAPDAAAHTIAALQTARFVVASSDDAHAALAGCASAAIRDGRLGFVLRQSFTPRPHIGSWTIDDGRSDALLRRDDHPALQIFERVVQTAPATVAAFVRCDTP